MRIENLGATLQAHKVRTGLATDTMMNKGKLPQPQAIQPFGLPELTARHDVNGIPLLALRGGTQEIVRVDVVFRAGRLQEKKRLQSRATRELISSGTQHLQAVDIAKTIDMYGAVLQTTGSIDISSISLFTLGKYFPQCLKVLQQVCLEPIFPEKEVETYVQINKARLRVDLEKTDVVAFRELTALIFGEEHLYGYNSLESDFDALKQVDCQSFFVANFHSGHALAFISGQYHDQHLRGISDVLSAIPVGIRSKSDPFPLKHNSPVKRIIQLEHKVQASIRLGRVVCDAQHSDYMPLNIACGILGGYFGSRLMTNLREKHGLSYGAYAAIEPLFKTGYMYISVDVSPDMVDKALEEINSELDALCNQMVSSEGLSMYRSATLGSMLSNIDGPFNTMDTYKTLAIEERTPPSFLEWNELLWSITPQKIQDIALKYFQPDSFYCVVVQ
jgi:predicted Zn-dependent peptidase